MSVAFLLPGSAGPILVDAGLGRDERRIWRRLAALGQAPSALQLIVLTHSHLDHSACLPALLKMSGARLAAHPLASAGLRGGPVRVPPARTPVGKAMSAIYRLAQPWLVAPSAQVEILLQDGARLDDWGLAAAVLYTPGHTADSLTLLLDNGVALVGDLLVARGRRAYRQPYFVQDDAALASSIERLRQAGARVVYTSHSPHALEPAWE